VNAAGMLASGQAVVAATVGKLVGRAPPPMRAGQT